MARQLRWNRNIFSNSTSGGATGPQFDLAVAGFLEGETLTTIHASFQMVYDRPNNLAGAYGTLGTFGLITAPLASTSPPARPQTNPQADWLWLSPFIWRQANLTFTSTGQTAGHLQEASVENIKVKAQRRAPAGGLKVWCVWQWEPALASDASMIRRAWISAGILEAA